jgi:hypothetical protein
MLSPISLLLLSLVKVSVARAAGAHPRGPAARRSRR